jgi:hypothetical protein
VSYTYHPWFENGMAGFRVVNEGGTTVYTLRMHAPDQFGAIRIEVLDRNNKLVSSELFSIYFEGLS